MTDPEQDVLPVDPESIDQRVILHGVSWEDYERLLEIRGESSVPRMTYLEGELELMTPAYGHEDDLVTLGRLIYTWSEETGVPLVGLGSVTLKKKRVKRGAEGDISLRLGNERSERFPEIVIEVVRTSGGLSKLDVYRKLGIREVWFLRRGKLTLHAVRGEAYEPVERSEVLPGLDIALIERCLAEPTQLDALRALRTALRA